MKNSYTHYADLINRQFTKSFDKIYKSSGKHQRAKLLPCMANVYRRWYYSSMVENTYLTPANLFEALNWQYSRQPSISPNVSLRTPVKYTGLSFTFQSYCREGHPIVADFRIIMDCCQPSIDLTEMDQMPEADAIEAAKKLHMQDPYYAMYLLAIALEMGFLVKIPSIHVNRAQPVRGIEKRMDISPDEMFKKIVQSSLRYAARSLSDLIPLPEPIFDEEYLLEILKEPVETDIIFQRLYDTIGVDLEDLIGLDIFEELDLLDMAVISGTYLLGILLDKFFLTPFGHYLKLIRPVYMLPFDFENEISVYLDTYIDEDELGVAFYAPCSQYYLTELGLEYFGVRASPVTYLDIKNKLDFSEISMLFEKGNVSNIQALTKALERESHVFLLKVKDLADQRLWLNVEVSDMTSLHRLYLELAYYFDLDKNGEYNFYPDETENPFMAYASPNQLRRSKKASEATIGSLNIEEKQVMVLTASYPRAGGNKHKEKWHIEVLKKQQGKPGQAYPMVTRLGKALREYFEWP